MSQRGEGGRGVENKFQTPSLGLDDVLQWGEAQGFRPLLQVRQFLLGVSIKPRPIQRCFVCS